MNLRRAVSRALPLVGTLAGIAFLVHVARPHWVALRASGDSLDLWWVAAGLAALTVHYAIAFVIWRLCLRGAGAAPSHRQALDTWVPSLLARYVPGKVWSHGVRVALARRAGLTMPDVTAAVGWEILVAVAGTGIVALVMVERTMLDRRIRMGVFALALACLAVLALAQMMASRGRAHPWLARIGLRQPLAVSTLAALGTAQLLAWIVYGVAHWCLARGIAPLPLSDLRSVTGAVALAWIGGYLSFFTPAGLGVREGLLTLLLAPVLGAGPVLMLAGLSRLGAIALEVALFVGWSMGRLRVGRRAPSRP